MIGRVVDKFILKLEEQLADKNVSFVLSDAARKYLGDKGYDRAMGARPLARVIDSEVKNPLVDELLFGKLTNGGEVQIDVKDDKLSFTIIANRKQKTPPKGKGRTKKEKVLV